MCVCDDMNGIAPVENGLVSSRATSRPSSPMTAKFGERAVPDRSRRITDPLHGSLAVEGMGVHARPGGPALAVDLQFGLVGLVAEEIELLEPRLEAEVAKRVGDGLGGAERGVTPRGAGPDADRQRFHEVHALESSSSHGFEESQSRRWPADTPTGGADKIRSLGAPPS